MRRNTNIFKVGSLPIPCCLQIHAHNASGNCSCVFDYMEIAYVFPSINYNDSKLHKLFPSPVRLPYSHNISYISSMEHSTEIFGMY